MEVSKNKYCELNIKEICHTIIKNDHSPQYENLHRSLNTSRGVLRSPELSICSIKEINLNLKMKQQISDVKRISKEK